MKPDSTGYRVRNPLSSMVLGITVSCACLVPQSSAAQSFPNRPIRIIVASAAGGGADLMGRFVGQRLNEALRQPVIIDNRAGASGAIGIEAVAKATPDGYTLLVTGAGALTIAPALRLQVPFDTVRDFAPVSLLAHSSFALVIHPSIPARTPKELIALARAKPGKLNFGSSGTGGSPHLAGELFKNRAKIDIGHVPYKGLAPAITDLIAGQIDLLFADLNLVQQPVQAGRLRALAVTGAQRSTIMPELPTVAETVLPGYQAGTWYGMLAPADTPRDIVVKLNTEINRILATDEMRQRLATQGAERAPVTPEQFSTFIRTEIDKWAKVVKAANLRTE